MLKWKDSYSVNVEEIDNQHKKLFEIGISLYNLSSLKDDFDHYDEIVNIIDELRDYTIYHFNFEEDLLRKNGYEDIESHSIEHDFFVKKLKRIEKKDIDGQQNQAIMEMTEFLIDWISSHILQSDMKYKAYLNSKGVY